MKLKFILCLALTLSYGLLGCSKTKTDSIVNPTDATSWVLPEEVQGEVWNKTILTNWVDTKVRLYRTTGEVTQLNAKKAIYQIWTTNNWVGSYSSQNVGVVAFVDPQNGKAWIGSANDLDFFIEDDSEIFDLNRNLFSGTLSWRKSLIVKAVQDEDVGGMIRRFENDVNGWWLLQTSGRTLLSSYFRQWFFYPHVMVSYVGFTPIDRIEVNREKLRIDFTSPAYQTKGSVWIDLKTWKVLKASEYK
ncbi:MAG TPA: hypothetical protein VFM25_08470 [Verrucomicrobiae bacterium]|nr:hypothetical protein [Verrucomicrobiae bacterium]